MIGVTVKVGGEILSNPGSVNVPDFIEKELLPCGINLELLVYFCTSRKKENLVIPKWFKLKGVVKVFPFSTILP